MDHYHLVMDDDFFDDGGAFGELGESELAALEENAIQATQAQSHGGYEGATGGGVYRRQGPSHRADFTTTLHQQPNPWSTGNIHYQQTTNLGPVTVPTLRDVSLRTSSRYRQDQRSTAVAPVEYSRYDETEELWDTAGPNAPGQEDQYYNYEHPQQIQQGQMLESGVHEVDYGRAERELGSLPTGLADRGAQRPVSAGKWGAMEYQKRNRDSAQVQALQTTIKELEEKIANLQNAHQKAENRYLAKDGEVQIVRGNNAKLARQYEQQLQTLQANQKKERERYEQEQRTTNEEMEKMKTRIMFLTNDFDEVLRKNKTLERSNTGAGEEVNRNSAQSSPLTTPKKKKQMPLRDGFDDDDLVMSSPKFKSKTPSKKRKRPPVESPVSSLPLAQSRKTPANETSQQLHLVNEEILQRLWDDDNRFDLFEAIEAHRPELGATRTLEALSRYSLPSTPDTTIASLFIDHITTLKHNSSKAEFPTIVGKSILSIWRSILDDRFWEPFHLILDLLSFVVMWSHGNICVAILDQAMDLLQVTVDINAIPMIRRETGKLVPEIDTEKCLILLESIAFGAMVEEVSLRRFWKLIRVDFALIMLSPNQPLQDIHRFVSMLCTSVFGDSFGPQLSNEQHQRQNELHIMDAITRLLVEVPDVSREEPRSHNSRIAQLRKEVIHFLGCIVGTEMGSNVIISHPSALSRLVRRISDELEEVYDFKGDVSSSVELINIAVRLLHTIIINHPKVQLGTKLSGGATHKHLVAMTRLAFSPRLLQEAGIEEDVLEYAYNILEMSVTPEEGEALQGLFATPRISGR